MTSPAPSGQWLRLTRTLQMACTRVESLLASVTLAADFSIPTDLDDAVRLLSRQLNDSSDVVVRRYRYADGQEGALVYLEGMVDQRVIDQDLMRALTGMPAPKGQHFAAPVGGLRPAASTEMLGEAVVRGDAVVLAHGAAHAWLISAAGYQMRSIDAAKTERNVLGPKAAFVESLKVNIMLLRRYLATPDLRVETLTLGVRSHTSVAMVYLASVADPRLVAAVRGRLRAIRTDIIITSVFARSFIRDNPRSPFPTLSTTERPDWSSWMISDGRVIVMVDGDPFALIAPTVFWDFFRTIDDYTHDYVSGSFIRFIRFIGAFVGILTPGLYVALIQVHPDLIPTDLALAMVGSREGLPFPAFVEMAMMLVVFEILREVSVRIPKTMGQTLGVVGGLVIGQAGVSAGIISPLMVVIIAITSLSLFITPKFELTATLRVLLWGGLVLGTVVGLFGLTLFLLLIVIHLTSLTSFGAPYLAPVSPWSKEALMDVFIRMPIRTFKRRSGVASPQDIRRQGVYRQPFDKFDLESSPDTSGEM